MSCGISYRAWLLVCISLIPFLTLTARPSIAGSAELWKECNATTECAPILIIDTWYCHYNGTLQSYEWVEATGVPIGTEDNCTDGFDNDCDTFLDCEDSECINKPECSPPQWSDVGQNASYLIVGDGIKMYANWMDTGGLDSYIFSWNSTGVWQNDTSVSFSGNPDWSNVTKTVPIDDRGRIVGWKIYANDTDGNENVTSEMAFIVSPCIVNGKCEVGETQENCPNDCYTTVRVAPTAIAPRVIASITIAFNDSRYNGQTVNISLTLNNTPDEQRPWGECIHHVNISSQEDCNGVNNPEANWSCEILKLPGYFRIKALCEVPFMPGVNTVNATPRFYSSWIVLKPAITEIKVLSSSISETEKTSTNLSSIFYKVAIAIRQLLSLIAELLPF